MRITQPLIYTQLESLGLKSVVCECGGACWCVGMNTTTRAVNISCISCGLTGGDMFVGEGLSVKDGYKKLPGGDPPASDGQVN